MKLSELFEQMPKVVIDGKEYELVFGTRAKIQTKLDYVTDERIQAVIYSMFNGIAIDDLLNMLYACLLNSKAFNSKEELLDKIDLATPEDLRIYADSVMGAWTKASLTKEQIEKIEVLNAQSQSKKKIETMP